MLNPYFKKAGQGTPEFRNIIHKQTAEVIQQYGRDMFYITRKAGNYNALFGEDYAGTFDGHFKIEMRPTSTASYGDTDMLSKFGLEVRDEAMIVIAGRRFREVTELDHPYEGDLIFDPMSKRLFEIKHIENEEIFHPLNTLPEYVLKCELFEYSHEKMETGVREVDMIDGVDDFKDADGNSEYTELTQRDNDSINDALLDLAGSGDIVDQWDTQSINNESDDFTTWNASNPFG